jgi:hypothetical protein
MSNADIPAVAVNVTGLPLSPTLVAVNVFVPADAPIVQVPTVAMPLELVVVGFVPPMLPPPLATAHVTDTPLTLFPSTSVTRTDGGVGTAALVTAD